MPEKILIIDDELETLQVMGLMLQRMGFTVFAASNGSQALALLRKENPTLVILDSRLLEMDGPDLARQIRANPRSAGIPILMLIAKTQEEDKIAGIAAGADDFITKPVNPTELSTRVWAILGKTGGLRIKRAEGTALTVGFIAAKGGIGLSSVTLNLGLILAQKNKLDPVIIETHPGRGSFGLELGFSDRTGLASLLRLSPNQVDVEQVEKALVRTPYGVRILLASNLLNDVKLCTSVGQAAAIFHSLQRMTSVLLLDLGLPDQPLVEIGLDHCHELVVVTAPYPSAVKLTRQLMDELTRLGFGENRPLSVVLVNRVRADRQLSISEVQESLGYPVSQVIPPVPEMAFQASMKNLPFLMIQQDQLLLQQFIRMADLIAQRAEK